MSIPRIIIAGSQSGVGKTTLTLGLLYVLKEQGYNVQPFKVGPDYIDTGLHKAICKTNSHNLDSWMGNDDVVRKIFDKYAYDKDIAVIEGVMGLFDGARGKKDIGSTAHIAKILQAPVVLVVNSRGMARSCAALISGYKNFDPNVNIAGVIFNNVGSNNHAEFLEEIVEEELDIPCLGCLKRNTNIEIPERHLGLVPASENQSLNSKLKPLGHIVRNGVKLEKLLETANSAPQIDYDIKDDAVEKKNVRIGVAMDDAFNFYYKDSLTFLEELGARISYFSPLKDEEIPDVHGLFLGGGFPESYLEELSANKAMLASIKNAYEKGMPIYAECGGYMYLMEEMQDFNDNPYSGAGIIPGKVKMSNKLAALGYVRAVAVKDSILCNQGEEVRGHEFHWSEMEEITKGNTAFNLYGGKGKDGRIEGYCTKNLLASYVHLHFRSNPDAAHKFIEQCENFLAADQE